mmetsp:Transcript_118397/g.379582  ORF Transcript_118397/g.379582 Transcript_118397/m.379582 type:complete len:145 (-) Transcript_118397:390-824(-)
MRRIAPPPEESLASFCEHRLLGVGLPWPAELCTTHVVSMYEFLELRYAERELDSLPAKYCSPVEGDSCKRGLRGAPVGIARKVLLRIAARWLLHEDLKEEELVETYALRAVQQVPHEALPEGIFIGLKMSQVQSAIKLVSQLSV